jgi:hypothetical protein
MKKPKKKTRPTERQLVELGLANNATAEILEKFMRRKGDAENQNTLRPSRRPRP